MNRINYIVSELFKSGVFLIVDQIQVSPGG